MNPYLIVLLTLLFSAFFSGMEMAFISANKLRIELDKKQGLLTGRIVSIFINSPTQYITTMLLGNNISLVIYGLVMAGIMEPYIALITPNPVFILIVQTLVSTLLILLVAEFLPKTLFRGIANTALNVFSYPLLIIYVVIFPVTIFINWISDLFILALRGNNKDELNTPNFYNKLDLLFFLDQSRVGKEQEQIEEENELKLFQNALDFTSVKVRDCMVPRTEIEAVDITISIETLKKKFIDTGFSKILVYDEEPDNIVGYVTTKSMFKNPENIKSHIINIKIVPETMSANKLLQDFIKDKKSVAVVVDEFGGISGMLTIEDIIEEIFGEIEDEYDSTELVEKKISETEYILSGRIEIDALNENYNFNLPEEEEFDTIAGYILHHHENIPEHNEVISIENFSFKILKVTKTKIELVHLTVER